MPGAPPPPGSPTSFDKGLRQLGYVEDQNIAIERRYASGQMNRNRKQLFEFATKNRLPVMYENSSYVDEGDLMSYRPSQSETLERALHHTDKILKGAKPGELPIEQPTKFEFVINLKAAKQIGLTIPPAVLARAEGVIR
jgi:putative ABC transport system substrate-binding protein